MARKNDRWQIWWREALKTIHPATRVVLAEHPMGANIKAMIETAYLEGYRNGSEDTGAKEQSVNVVSKAERRWQECAAQDQVKGSIYALCSEIFYSAYHQGRRDVEEDQKEEDLNQAEDDFR